MSEKLADGTQRYSIYRHASERRGGAAVFIVRDKLKGLDLLETEDYLAAVRFCHRVSDRKDTRGNWQRGECRSRQDDEMEQRQMELVEVR